MYLYVMVWNHWILYFPLFHALKLIPKYFLRVLRGMKTNVPLRLHFVLYEDVDMVSI